MYRTSKTRDLVLKGIPESLRGELWLLFSGNYFSLTVGGTFVLLAFKKCNDEISVEACHAGHRFLRAHFRTLSDELEVLASRTVKASG